MLNIYKQRFLLLQYFDSRPLKSHQVIETVTCNHIDVLVCTFYSLFYFTVGVGQGGEIRRKRKQIGKKKYSIFLLLVQNLLLYFNHNLNLLFYMVAIQPRHACFGEGTCGQKSIVLDQEIPSSLPSIFYITGSNTYFYPSSVFLSFPCNFQNKVLTLLLSLQLNSTCPPGHPMPPDF